MYISQDFKNNHLFENYGVEYHMYNGIYTKPHKHPGYWECFLITNGRLTHIYRNKKNILEKNSLCLMRPEDEHCFSSEGKSSVAKHINLAIDDATFKSILDPIDKNLYPKLLAYDGLLSLEMTDRQVEEFFTNMQKLFSSPFSENDLIAITLKSKFVGLAESMYAAKFSGSVSYPPIIREAVALMRDENYVYEPIEAICDRLPYSRTQLLSAFKKYTGKTMIGYFTNLKLERAYNLLVSTDYKVLYICSLVGFDSISYFNKQFRLKYGITPSSVRSGRKEN